MQTPFVSIIIPVLNGQETLPACLESICKQDYKSYEVVVVDNNSTDQTKKIINSFQEKNPNIKYVFEPLRRRGAARYAGERQAQGTIILMTDADCLVTSDWITAMIAPIVGGQQVAVQGMTKSINTQNYWSEQYQQEKERLWKARRNDQRVGLLDTANFAIKMEVLREVGYSNPQFDYSNDAELMVRLKLRGYQVHFLEAAVLHSNPDNAWQLFQKNFVRGQWDWKLRHLYHAYQNLFTSWTKEDDHAFWQSLFRALKTKEAWAMYAVVAGVGWRLGVFWIGIKSMGGSSRLNQNVNQYFITASSLGIIPQVPQELSGSLWGITTYFNPNRYGNKLENYRYFREISKNQGLKLITVELAFGDRPFELNEKDADILIQRRANSVLWQKERLLNIALKELPRDCDKVVWLDADVVFKNEHWIRETSRLLQLYKVVQPFEYVLMLPKGTLDCDQDVLWQQCAYSPEFVGKAYKMSRADKTKFPYDQFFGHPGFAWAARRDCLDQIGFYDKMILGWGDYLMAAAFYQEVPMVYNAVPASLGADAQSWADKVHESVQGSVYYTPGNILHLWHGERSFRLYKERLKILSQYEFSPEDVRLNSDECWEWATPKKQLHAWVAQYFGRRNEEGTWAGTVFAGVRNFWDFRKDLIVREFVLKLKRLAGKTTSVVLFIGKLINEFIVSPLVKRLVEQIDWAIGQVGLFLKRRIPMVYYFLKGRQR